MEFLELLQFMKNVLNLFPELKYKDFFWVIRIVLFSIMTVIETKEEK